jgi:hypothetical protein
MCVGRTRHGQLSIVAKCSIIDKKYREFVMDPDLEHSRNVLCLGIMAA